MNAWNDFESALRKMKPEELKKLNNSISSDQVKKLEAILDGNHFPQDYNDLLHKHDGSKDWDDPFSFFTWDFLSSEKIIASHEHLKSTLEHHDGDMAHFKEVPGVQKSWYDPLWIPIFMSGDGKEYTCLDFNPASGGIKGQVICVHVHRGPNHNFKDFSNFFKGIVKEAIEELEDDVSTESIQTRPFKRDLNGRIMLSTEAIHYQDTKTFKELELAFRDIMFQSPEAYEEQKRKNEQLIEAIINNSFKSNCSISFGEEWPCVRIFDEYQNNVLIRNEWREYFVEQMNFTKRFIGGSGGVKAGVNIMTAQLSGLFSELPFTIYLPDVLLCRDGRDSEGYGVPSKYRLSSEEMTAVVLHEIGHFFTYCETFSRTVTTNQALAAMVKELDGTYAVERREVIIAKAVDDLKLKDVDIKALAKTDKKAIIETAIVTEVAEQSRAELGISIYDTTASEQLADQFASRHGVGAHLVTALDKIHGLFGGGNAYLSQPLFMFWQIVSIALMFIPPICILAIPYNIMGILFGGFTDSPGGVYDTPEVRFRRIKMDTLARLKNRAISEVEKKRTLADLAAIEKAMEHVKDKTEWTEWVATRVIPTYRKYRKTRSLQQQLEQLGNSDLFARAAELSTLS